jgi:hypothetical protein
MILGLVVLWECQTADFFHALISYKQRPLKRSNDRRLQATQHVTLGYFAHRAGPYPTQSPKRKRGALPQIEASTWLVLASWHQNLAPHAKRFSPQEGLQSPILELAGGPPPHKNNCLSTPSSFFLTSHSSYSFLFNSSDLLQLLLANNQFSGLQKGESGHTSAPLTVLNS